jgi:hypothetical protein
MYRAVNLEIDRAEGAAGAGADETFDILCECGDDACSATLDVSHTEYEEAHRQRDRFMVALGHEDKRIEHIVKPARPTARVPPSASASDRASRYDVRSRRWSAGAER